MVYGYYRRLTRAQRRVYDRSDAITAIALPESQPYQDHVLAVHEALSADDRERLERRCNVLCESVTVSLGIPAVRVVVKAKRPRRDWGELHGLYESSGNGDRPVITVWMRTAQRRQVVAVRTFLRTLLHELCHHLDYVHLGLRDSYHTEGFYKRESSLYAQLTRGIDLPARGRSARQATSRGAQPGEGPAGNASPGRAGPPD